MSPTRKQRFRAALVLAGLTMEQWAAERDLSTGHVSQVLDEKRESMRLDAEIDAFIAEHLPAA